MSGPGDGQVARPVGQHVPGPEPDLDVIIGAVQLHGAVAQDGFTGEHGIALHGAVVARSTAIGAEIGRIVKGPMANQIGTGNADQKHAP